MGAQIRGMRLAIFGDSSMLSAPFVDNNVSVAVDGGSTAAQDSTADVFSAGRATEASVVAEAAMKIPALQEDEATIFEKRIFRALQDHGWYVNKNASSCLLEGSHEREWHWSSEAGDDEPQLLAREIEGFACWLEIS